MSKIYFIPDDTSVICRFCLSTDTDLVDLFKNEEAKTELHEIANQLNIKVLFDKNMPLRICTNCEQVLYKFKNFKQSVLKNEVVLQKTYKPNKLPICNSPGFIQKCTTCQNVFSNYYQFSQHKLECSNNLNLFEQIIGNYDEYCETAVNKRLTSLINERKLGKISTNKCDICEKDFKLKTELSLHFIQHVIFDQNKTVDPPIFCNFCGKLLTTLKEYKIHVRENHESKLGKISCDYCGKSYKNEFKLMEHIHEDLCNNIMQNDEGDLYTCPICNLSFETKQLLCNHSLQHLAKHHNCKVCKEKFLTLPAFNKHLKMHPKYKHQCKICKNLYTKKGYIQSHIKEVHASNKETYICEICGELCKNQKLLNMHSNKKHLMNTPFFCAECGYSAISKNKLVMHIRKHTKERRFKCTYENCEQSYKTVSHLKKHTKTH